MDPAQGQATWIKKLASFRQSFPSLFKLVTTVPLAEFWKGCTHSAPAMTLITNGH